jgi:hypothetical protein
MVKNADFLFVFKGLQIRTFDIFHKICYNLPMIKNIIIFDLDQTVIDSSHRNPNNPDGTLNLEQFFKLRTRKNIFRDKLLPLAKVFKQLKNNDNFIIVATARNIDHNDVEFLKTNGLYADMILSRKWIVEDTVPDAELKARKLISLFNLKQFKNKPKFMFDDASKVITKMRELGIVTLNAIKVNERLKNG